ncbi:MAG: ABC transporter permease [Pirellulales bacterium]|jgi:ABC-type transport system involved in multi-copper enzyme maturation permease subunit|nr:ABC transporter permease [Pirellulales bacterium]
MTNPILQREVLGFLRSWWAPAIQLVPAVTFSVLVLIRWPTDGQVSVAGTQAHQVLELFGYGALALVLLLVPIFPATTLVRERRQGTLALLLNSPMSGWSIYAGKLAGNLTCVFLPLIMSLPAAAACYAMTGLGASQHLGRLYLVLFMATIQYTVLALYVSSFASTTDSALRTTFGIILLIAVGSLGPYQLLQGQSLGWLGEIGLWLQSLSPLPAMMEILGHGDVTAQGLVTRSGSPLRFALLAAATATFCAIHTIVRLKPTMLDRPRPQGVITQDRSHLQQWLRRFVFLVDPHRRSGAIGDWTNPVLVKEFRSRRFGRSQWMFRLIALSALISLLLTYMATTGTFVWGPETIGVIMVVLQIALVLILTPSLAASLISSERESGGWTLLMMTPLTGTRIIIGKLLSVAATVAMVLMATLPGYIVMMVIQPVLKQQVLYVLLSLVLTALFAVTLSAAVSSFFQRTAPATITCYALLALFLITPMLIWLGRDAPFGKSVVESILIASPLAAALQAMQISGFTHYELLPVNWWIMGGASLLCTGILGLQTWRITRPL